MPMIYYQKWIGEPQYKLELLSNISSGNKYLQDLAESNYTSKTIR